DSHFWPGRTSLAIPAGHSDSLSIHFRPTAEGTDSATITLAANDPLAPHHVRVRGHSTPVVGAGTPKLPARFALWQNRPNPFTARTIIQYALPTASEVSLDVFDLQGNRVGWLVKGTRGRGFYNEAFGEGAVDGDGGRPGALA